MTLKKIVGEAKTHILRIPAVICTVQKQLTLGNCNGQVFIDVKIDAIPDFGHQTLFGIEYVSPARQSASANLPLENTLIVGRNSM